MCVGNSTGVGMGVCKHVGMYIHVYIYIYIYTCMYMYIHVLTGNIPVMYVHHEYMCVITTGVGLGLFSACVCLVER